MKKNSINIEQVIKILKILIIATLIILIGDVIFEIPVVNEFFANLITNSKGIYIWIFIWLLMFLQVTILPIPAYVVLSASVSIGIECFSWQYLLTVISAYMAGCILAYWLGRWFGVKAVKWCAGSEEDFDKWSGYLNKKGKLWYLVTVMFPFFPDDLLCLVAGGVKFNFGFYTIANFIGRSIGLVAMIGTLKLIGGIGGGFPFMIIVWAVALLSEFILWLVLRKKNARNKV